MDGCKWQNSGFKRCTKQHEVRDESKSKGEVISSIEVGSIILLRDRP